MNQHTLNLYLDFIQKLLNCPPEQEEALLLQHQHLITPELIPVMEQVAQELAAENNPQAAEALQTWAAKFAQALAAVESSVPHPTAPSLHHDRTEAYLKLIRALLECRKGAEAEVLAANQGLIDHGLVRLMQTVVQQMVAQGDRETAGFLEHWIGQIQHHWLGHELQTHRDVQPVAHHHHEAYPQAFTTSDSPIHALDPDLLTPRPVAVPTPALRQPSQPTAPQTKPSLPQALDQSLSAIAQALNQLEHTIADRTQPNNPLWYMEVLEQAQEANWLLTTAELRQIIGVEPRCAAGQTTFQRGNWSFEKVGKIGAQTMWRVRKETD